MPSIEVSEERGVRYLHFGSHWIQGAMRVARPWALELEYTREMMLPLAVRDDPAWPATVLQIGLGAASVTKFLYRYRPKASIMVVEIMPEVAYGERSVIADQVTNGVAIRMALLYLLGGGQI